MSRGNRLHPAQRGAQTMPSQGQAGPAPVDFTISFRPMGYQPSARAHGTLVFVNGLLTVGQFRDELLRRRDKIGRWKLLIVDDALTLNADSRPDSVVHQYQTTYHVFHRYLADGACILINAPLPVLDWWQQTARLHHRTFTFA